MTSKGIEQELQDKGSKAPRVTGKHIEDIIVSEHYFTGYDGIGGDGAWAKYKSTLDLRSSHESLKLITFCVLVLKNGFTVTGESACASPENFDAEIGRKIARENAVNKIWMLEGYLLKQNLSEVKNG